MVLNERSINLLHKVDKTLKDYKMIEDESPIIIGVSGGPDSMALLDIIAKLSKNQIVVAHLNHKFRGEEAKKDAEFVQRKCEERGIPVEIKEYDVPAFIMETGLGAQEAARQVRYKFYLEVARKWNARYIALGHHANDQAETILMRIIRGTGIHGLSGIPYVRDFDKCKIIRPLLNLMREEIEGYCSENKIIYRTDQSNYSTKYFRNEIRLNVLPYLEQYNDKIITHLHQLGKVAQDESSFLDKMAKEFITNNKIDAQEKCYIFSISSIQKLDIALQKRVIHLILRYLNFKVDISYKHIDDIIRLIHHSHPSKSINLPGMRVYRNYGQIIFISGDEIKEEPYSLNLSIPGEIVLPNTNIKIKAFVTGSYKEQQDLWAVFDFDRLKDGNLIVRSRVAGDRLELFGVNGSKKVKDLFIDEKVSRGKRDLYPLIEQDNKILWIPGVKRSRHALIDNATKNFLYIIVKNL